MKLKTLYRFQKVQSEQVFRTLALAFMYISELGKDPKHKWLYVVQSGMRRAKNAPACYADIAH